MRMRNPSFKHCKLFSLVELLVVVMVISVLMSLLAPALKRTIYSAKQVNCVSNIKNLTLGISLYADDHSDLFPDAYPGKPDTIVNADGTMDRRIQIRPYFNNYCGETFVCPLAVNANEGNSQYNWVDNIEDQPGRRMSYSIYVGGYQNGQYASLAVSKPAYRLGDPLVNAKVHNNTIDRHPTLPESYIVVGDTMITWGNARDGFSSHSLRKDKTNLWHKPNPTAEPIERHSARPPYYNNTEFSHNNGYQDGSVRTAKSFAVRSALEKTHANLLIGGNMNYGYTLPLENL
jgi:competence protein ComGC